MNDETQLLVLETNRNDSTTWTRDEVVMAYKLDKAKRAASKLVGEMMQAGMEKPHFWNYWRRIERAERQAILATKLLDEQALKLHDGNLCAHWVRVRMSIKERSYQ